MKIKCTRSECPKKDDCFFYRDIEKAVDISNVYSEAIIEKGNCFESKEDREMREEISKPIQEKNGERLDSDQSFVKIANNLFNW